MSKLYVQQSASVLDYSGALAGSNAGIGGSISGSLYCNGFSRLVGMLTLTASLQSGSGFQVLQSADSGTNWDLKSACQTLAAGTSPFSFEILGDAVKVLVSNGSSANTVRTLWRVIPIQSPDLPARLSASISGGSVIATSGSIVVTNQISASVSGGSIASLAGENHIGEIGGRTTVVTACFPRDANTTQYAIGDMWASGSTNGTLVRLPGCARKNNGSGVIDRIVLIDSASQATMPQLYLYIFDNVITSPSDNAPFPLTDAEAETIIGVIPVTSWYPGGSALNAISVVSNLTIPFVCQSACNSLWAIPVLQNTYTPTSAENLTARIGILQD